MDSLKKDHMTGEELFNKAVEFFKKNKTLDGIDCLERAAKNGYVEAQYQLGAAIIDTRRNLPLSEGIKWLTIAAENNHIFAINDLALCYQTGNGVEKNLSKALKLLEKAAELGDFMAYYNIGQTLFFGIGVKKNILKGLAYVQKAAASGAEGCDYAMNMLGQVFESGYFADGVEIPQDMDKALEWYTKAVELGNKDSMKALQRLGIIEGDFENEDIANKFMAMWLHYDISLIDELFDVTFSYSSYHQTEDGYVDAVYFKNYDLKHFEKEVTKAMEDIVNNRYELRARIRECNNKYFVDTIQNGVMIAYELNIENGKVSSLNKYTIDG